MNNQKIEYERISVPPDIITKAIEEEDTTAQLVLGKAYYKATSVENNSTVAFRSIRRSAKQGNMEAQFLLGNIYALGCGTIKSLSDSYKWYTKAAIQGYKKALIRIHNLYQEDMKMHCRGQLNSKEKQWTDPNFKKKNKIRELFEYRLEQKRDILNGAIEYYTNQFKYYQSSDQKNTINQLNLAFLYQHGYGTKKCSRWAFEYYSMAAEQGNSDAQYNLGRLYQQHTDKKFNIRDAFKWYTRSAQSENIAAQRCLAYFYLKGLATDIDHEKAVSWYTKAAEAGDSQSQVTLGMLYRKGDYVEQDLSKAVRWYTQAARQGNIVAQNCLSQLFQRELLTGVELEEDMQVYFTEDSMHNRLCSKLPLDVSKLEDLPEFKRIDRLTKHVLIGDGSAMYEIGLRYYHGNKRFPQDKDTGLKWIKNAANREHKEAQFMLAELYKEGDSIEQDYQKSYIWYKKTAKQKDAKAQCQIGIMFNKGLGVRKDSLEASKWFIWATDQENSDAQYYLGILRFFGSGIRKDKTEAEEWLYKSVRQRNIQACATLGRLYLQSIYSFEDSIVLGLKLLEFASKNQHVEAQLFLGSIYQKGASVQQNIPKCIELYTKAAYYGHKDTQYNLAIIYLNGDGVNQDYIKAYNLLKQAKNRNHLGSIHLFYVPIVLEFSINDYSNILAMFIEVTEKAIDDLAYNIGFMYEHGIKSYYYGEHVNINYAKAIEWYLDASNKGDSRADYRLGVMYEYGKSVEKNITTAINYYKNAAEKENCNAMYKLACIYLEEHGVIKNLLEAFHLYTKVSFMGHKGATEAIMVFENNEKNLYDLDYIDNNIWRPIDRIKLISMLEKTTEEGYSQLQYQLGVMYEQNNDNINAFKWFRLATDVGVTDAYYRLGVIYEEGKGVEQNYSMGADLYQKATEKDHESACFRLGELYRYGNGVELDYLKAYRFYKRAAEMDHEMASRVLNITLETKIEGSCELKENFFAILYKEYFDSLTMFEYVAETGDTDIQFKVGFAYENNYTEPNYVEVYKWYSMAARGSHREAIYHLGLLYERGLGVSQDYHNAIESYNQAYQLGSNDALHRLGTIYHYGRGVEISPVKAIECYTLSAKFGNPKYQCELGRLYEEGELAQENPLDALKWYMKAYLQGYDDIGSKLYTMFEDKPYENFFFKKLARNLSIASCNYFSLNDEYEYKYYGDVNNRLGYMHYFGIGTDKNLNQAFQYFMKEYSDMTEASFRDFGFFQYSGISLIEKIDILKEFEKNEECMDQISSGTLHKWAMFYYNGVVQTQNTSEKNSEKRYTSIDELDLDDPNEHIVLEKDSLKAFNYIKRAADKNNHGALYQIGIMYCCGYGVKKDIEQGERCFDIVSRDSAEFMKKIAILYHTDNDMQNFSEALKYYNQLEKFLVDDSSLTQRRQIEMNEIVKIGLGLLYEYGNGVEQDYQKTLTHYNKLIKDYNSSIGNLRLGLMYYYGKGVPIDYKKALDLVGNIRYDFLYGDQIPYVYDQNNLQTSDDVGCKRNLVYCTLTQEELNGERYYYLGLMYKHGQSTPKDENKAQYNFKRALDYGCQRAANEIKD